MLNISLPTMISRKVKIMGRSDIVYLFVNIDFSQVPGGLCRCNFKRDIVDTCCHASRDLDTTGPNKPQILLCKEYISFTQVGCNFKHFILSNSVILLLIVNHIV